MNMHKHNNLCGRRRTIDPDRLPKRTSSPTKNIKKIRAKFAIVLITPSDAAGKIVAVNRGMRPIAVGPRTIPASISATTAG